MNIKNRLKKLQSQIIGNDSEFCACPDTLILAATPFWKFCYKCGKDVDIYSWKSWQMVNPTIETNYFAFGMRRDDKRELTDKPNEFFQDEVITILQLWQILKRQAEQQ
jgi:hypothetical protein